MHQRCIHGMIIQKLLIDEHFMSESSLEYNIIIIGAGPAGLATAIQAKRHNPNLKIIILEKGAEIGAHILSGAVIETTGLQQIAPKYHEHIKYTKVTNERLNFFTKRRSIKLPIPKQINNNSNIIVSLGEVCKYLAQIAEELEIDIITGIAAQNIIITNNKVIGVTTNAFGLDRNNQPLSNYQTSINIYAKQTVIAEGCRGSIAKQVMDNFQLTNNRQPQTYGLGIKEVWEVPNNQPGLIEHTVGFPLFNKAYGGGFVYHLDNNLISIGLITGLDYKNPSLDPFQEMQTFKTHPNIKKLLNNGNRISYGAKTIVEGGYQAIPKLTFAGGLIVGDSAGFINVAKIKGTNNAITSGIIAGKLLAEKYQLPEITAYEKKLHNASFIQELYKIRNIRPSFKYGMLFGLFYSTLELFITRGKLPFTFTHNHDRKQLSPKQPTIIYPKPDNIYTFNKSSSVYLSGTMHRDNQPVHLKLTDHKKMITINYQQYQSPETKYCPAEVYEIILDSNNPKLQINSQNCLHCKACDIKDPTNNIHWTPPEGGGGPNYQNM